MLATGTSSTPKPSTSQENENIPLAAKVPDTPLAIRLSDTPVTLLQKPSPSKRKLTMPVSGSASAKKSKSLKDMG